MLVQSVAALTRRSVVFLFPLGFGSAFLNNTPLVLLLTPAVRRWALRLKERPSKYLIPVSYATILGGACTLIGTSTNLVVDQLLRAEDPQAGLGFFELSKVALPSLFVGILFLSVMSYRLLPNRKDPTTTVSEQVHEFTSEFLVGSTCPLANKTLGEGSREFFRGELLIEIERGDTIIDSPDPEEIIEVDDRLVFVGDLEEIAKLHAIPALKSLADPHFKLDITSPHFAEVVITSRSALHGRTIKRVNFRTRYGASVLAVYREGVRVTGTVGDIILQSGDTLMLLSNQVWPRDNKPSHDFYYIKYGEKLPVFVPWRAALVLGTMILMVLAVTLGISMLVASSTAAAVLVLTKCISLREVRKGIAWSLLILIGSAYAFGTALQTTGVGRFIGENLLPLLGDNPYWLVGGIFLTTMLVTEMITNTAAALLIFPIALQTMELAGYSGPTSIKAVGVTVAIAASCSFMTPVGYHTNTIVFGPGGYKYTDYLKVGAPMAFIVFTISTFLIPRFFLS